MHQEAKQLNDPVWDCTLIKTMREKNDSIVNPIYNWLDCDIWEYIKKENMKVNPLYSRGYDRVGCIGCPLAPYHTRMKEFRDYPQYKQMYINAFNKAMERRKAKGMKEIWKSGQDMFDWWAEENKHNVKGQINLWENTGEETTKNA